MTLFDIAYDDFKREDTTNVIAINLYTDDKQPITPNASHTWKAKVSKGDKYVGEYPVTISGNTIKLSSSNLTRLPNGNYGLELWETYSGSTTIYPSAGVMEFRVHRNANDTLGTVDPTTDINRIIDDLHKAGQNIKVVATNTLPPGSKASVTQSIVNGENRLTFNIPQGDTDATATDALNKVAAIQTNGGGRNLFVGSIPIDKDHLNGWTIDEGYVGTHKYIDDGKTNTFALINSTDKEKFIFSPFLSLENGETYTLSYYAFATTNANSGEVYVVNQDYSETQTIAGNKKLSESKALRYVYTFVFDKPSGKYHFRFDHNGSTDGKWSVMYIGKPMLEKGTVAHDPQQAPEDIQAQINALKEAIKKLGGTV